MIAPVANVPPETREELIQHLERLTVATDQPSVRRWLQAKKVTLIALFTFGLLQYYRSTTSSM